MNTLQRYLKICVAIVLVYVPVSSAADAGTDDIQIEIKNGFLSLQTHDAPVDKVIREIGKLAGFKTVLADDFGEHPKVNASFKSLSVQRAVERLVNDKNRMIIYSAAKDNVEQRVISQIWLLGSGDASTSDEFDVNQTISMVQENTLNKQNLTKHKLTRLNKILREDQKVQARIMAASALGALQDEQAIPALESALLDQHASVRTEAIMALGRIEGNRAIMVLGNILLNGGTNMAERIMAAKALWQHDSEAAHVYLRAGKNDKLDQVRLASSKPSSLPKLGAKNDQIGSAVVQ